MLSSSLKLPVVDVSSEIIIGLLRDDDPACLLLLPGRLFDEAFDFLRFDEVLMLSSVLPLPREQTLKQSIGRDMGIAYGRSLFESHAVAVFT